MNRFSRTVAGAVALCVATAFTTSGAAGAEQATGLGTTTASHALVSLELADLLDVKVLLDEAKANIDKADGEAHGVSRLVPLRLRSGALPVLNGLTDRLPTFESRTPGGQPAVSGSAVDFASASAAAPALPLLGSLPLLGGTLVPTSLTSALDALGARSALDSALTRLSIAGLVTVDSVKNTAGTDAANAAAQGRRGLDVGAVAILRLGDLLGGIGLPLDQLSLKTISDLLTALSQAVNLGQILPTGTTTLAGAVQTLADAIKEVNADVAGNNATLNSVVKTVEDVSKTIAGLPAQLPVNPTTVINTAVLQDATVANALKTLTDALTGLLGTALSALDNLTVAKFDGAQCGSATKAADTLENSLATVTCAVGKVTVLGLELPGVDLLEVGKLLTSVTDQLGKILSIVHPDLQNLVKIGVFDKSTSVSSAGGYNKASATLDILSVKITPPALLANLVSSLTGGNTSSVKTLGAAGVANPAASLPLLGTNATALGNLLNLPAALSVLSKGLSLKVGTVQTASQFKAAAAPAPAVLAAAPENQLPRTGGDTRMLGTLAALLAALSLGVRWWARRPTTG